MKHFLAVPFLAITILSPNMSTAALAQQTATISHTPVNFYLDIELDHINVPKHPGSRFFKSKRASAAHEHKFLERNMADHIKEILETRAFEHVHFVSSPDKADITIVIRKNDSNLKITQEEGNTNISHTYSRQCSGMVYDQIPKTIALDYLFNINSRIGDDWQYADTISFNAEKSFHYAHTPRSSCTLQTTNQIPTFKVARLLFRADPAYDQMIHGELRYAIAKQMAQKIGDYIDYSKHSILQKKET